MTRACPQTFSCAMLTDMETSNVTEVQWEQLWPLPPLQKPRTGRPATDHSTVVNGVLSVQRTGSPWRSAHRHSQS